MNKEQTLEFLSKAADLPLQIFLLLQDVHFL